MPKCQAADGGGDDDDDGEILSLQIACT